MTRAPDCTGVWLGLLGTMALGACGVDDATGGQPAVPPAPTRAADVALVVDELEVRAAEIERVARWVELAQPSDSPALLRRLALTEVVLPRAAVASQRAGQRERARAEAKVLREQLLRAGEFELGPNARALERSAGNWQLLGLALFGPAQELPLGAWSEVEEAPGRFFLVRVDARSPAAAAPQSRGQDLLEISLFDVPYAELPCNREQAFELAGQCTLTYVSPDWREALPTEWLYHMHYQAPALDSLGSR